MNRAGNFRLEAEANARVAREPLHVRRSAEHDRYATIIGVELVRSLGAGGQRVLERVCACRGNIGRDDRAAGEGDLDADRIRCVGQWIRPP